MLIFSYKVSQSLRSLTLTKFYMQTKKKWREYYSTVLTRKKCALNLEAFGVLPQVASSFLFHPVADGPLVYLISPTATWARAPIVNTS